MTDQTIQQSFRALYRWARTADFAGHDPHDVLLSPVFRKLQQPLARLVALQLARRSPLDVRKLLQVPAHESPKGLALFLTGLLRAKELASPDWEAEAADLTSRLLRAAAPGGGWGYPFPWQSRTHFVPAERPNIVTTSFVGNALISAYRQFGRSDILDSLQKANRYILQDIPRTESPQGIAFGYAKDDPQIVFNASLLGAEFLARSSLLVADTSNLALAHQAADFVMHHQRGDGSWIYGLEPSQTWIDSFHTGFTILSLNTIGVILGEPDLKAAARLGFEYFRKTFIEPDFAVKYYHDRRYPVDAHALGQGLMTLAEFRDLDSARKVAAWGIDHMQSPKGYFYYQVHQLYTNRIAYMRWSNAWMFRGLAEIVALENDG